MRRFVVAVCVALGVSAGAGGARAQQAEAVASQPGETRAALSEPAVAHDAAGRAVLSARLRTTQLAGTPESPARNSRIVIENRSGVFYSFTSGYATFYGGDGVRCGDGLWKVEAFAPGESAEVDTPGLRLTCTPATWRVVAVNLLTRGGGDAAQLPAGAAAAETPAAAGTLATRATGATPAAGTLATTPEGSSSTPATPSLPPLEININGKTIPIQPGNPLEITVGRERVRIVVRPAP